MTDQIILGVKKEEDPSEDRVSIVPRDLKSLSCLLYTSDAADE